MKPFNRTLPILMAVLCAGCEYLPHRTIIITDQQGRPLSGAHVGPYPVNPLPFGPGAGGNSTDARGRVKIYDLDFKSYSLSAKGFRTREIAFPQHDDTTYALQRK